MRAFLEWLNIPKHIKNYIILKKINGYSRNRSGGLALFVIDFLMIALFGGAFYYINFINADRGVKKFGLGILIAFIFFFTVKIFAFSLYTKQKYNGIKKLILTDDEGRNVKAWDVGTKTALLIGKSAKDNEVDIDLAESEYAVLVSKQHAVLNFSFGSWYIEDIGSTNGSGLKRSDASARVLLEPGKPYPMNSGDTIYIANTKILVK
jgi:hypothetical protein